MLADGGIYVLPNCLASTLEPSDTAGVSIRTRSRRCCGHCWAGSQNEFIWLFWVVCLPRLDTRHGAPPADEVTGGGVQYVGMVRGGRSGSHRIAAKDHRSCGRDLPVSLQVLDRLVELGLVDLALTLPIAVGRAARQRQAKANDMRREPGIRALGSQKNRVFGQQSGQTGNQSPRKRVH